MYSTTILGFRRFPTCAILPSSVCLALSRARATRFDNLLHTLRAIHLSLTQDLWNLSRREGRKFAGSTSSLSGLLCHIYFLLSRDRHVDLSVLSRHMQAFVSAVRRFIQLWRLIISYSRRHSPLASECPQRPSCDTGTACTPRIRTVFCPVRRRQMFCHGW